MLARAGHQCQWVQDGRRCAITSALEAHHIVPLRTLYEQRADLDDPRRGVALCRTHHEQAEQALRPAAPVL